MRIIKIIFPFVLLSFIFACSEHEDLQSTGIEKNEINLQATISQINTTRVDDSGFADGDAIGVYAVNYDGEKSGALQVSDNQATNVKFVFDSQEYKWTGESPVYWKDGNTPIDVYGYYPYNSEVTSTSAYPFTVQRNQSTEANGSTLGGYEASDFLWAKCTKAVASTKLITLKFQHQMACVRVTLVEGEGFEDVDWATLEKTVQVENTYRNSTIDLSTGEVTMVAEDGAPQGIITSNSGSDYRAIVVPQAVASNAVLLSITVNGQSYQHKRSDVMTYVPGKMHNFTIKVDNNAPTGDYRFTIVDESITAWESDLVSHNGSTREYIVINVSKAGGLENAIKTAGLDPANIVNLKVIGEMNEQDFTFIRQNITNLEAINLKLVSLKNCSANVGGVTIKDGVIPDDAFSQMKYLTNIVFPDNLKAVGTRALFSTLLTGSLVIPEGVTHICGQAFSHSNFSGTLTLPTTLEYIGNRAFEDCEFSGELIIPENVTYIGSDAFSDCDKFSGDLHLPSNLKTLGSSAFDGTGGLTGNLYIPNGITAIDYGTFIQSGFAHVSFPEGLTYIGREAFWAASLTGNMSLPSTVVRIDDRAFSGNEFTSVTLPEGLEVIGSGAFSDCSSLQDTMRIPPLINIIPSSAFSGCRQLEAVILNSNIEQIKSNAFENCYSLNYIKCLSKEPPVIDDESSFAGVAKDNFTVEVPEGSVEAYRNAPHWSEFKRISAYRDFVCRPSKINVLNAGVTRSIVLNADAEWTMTECPSWCHVSQTSGNQKTELTLTIDAMAHSQNMRSGNIVFKLNGSEEYTASIAIGQYDYEYEENQSVTLQSASKGNGINLFIVGDGYDAENISSGVYLNDMKQAMEYFFGVEPYTTYRDYFNVYTAIAMSNESGIGTVNTLRDVKFETTYGDWSGTRITCNNDAVVDYAVKNVPDITEQNIDKLTAIVFANGELYDGITTMYTNGTAVAICPNSKENYPNDARGIVQHEAGGHGFGKLADEYVYHTAYLQLCHCLCCEHISGLQSMWSKGWGRNLSIIGKYKGVEWSHLIFDSRYGDITDIYEGGYYHSRGVYRPESNSCMNNNVPYFNTWSRQLIVERIMEYAGETFDFETFVSKDNREMGRDFNDTRSSQTEKSTKPRHHNAPVIINRSPLKHK